MISRAIELRIRELAAQFPTLILTGARQTGKTTLARSMFGDKPYLNLERPDILARTKEDPLGTLNPLRKTGAIFDEVQRFPELASWLQAIVDEDPKPGMWVLTGSNQLLIHSAFSQSLAGRAAYVSLSPFSSDEIPSLLGPTDEVLFRGWYPPLYDYGRAFKPSDWYEQYVDTYLERDLRDVARVKDLSQFRRFLSLCAGRSGQILNMSDLARDTGTSHTTVREWLSLLEQAYLLFFLKPYHENFAKRIVKNPKLYFYDCGLVCRLLGIREAGQLDTHPLRGAIFETMVVSDFMKRALTDGSLKNLYFWSSPSFGEIDLVIASGDTVSGTEIKSTATFHPELMKSLERWGRLAGIPADRLSLVYDGIDTLSFKGMRVRPWRHDIA